MSQTITPSQTQNSLAPNVITDITPEGNWFSDFSQETLAMTKRLFIQLQRRPSTLMAGIFSRLCG